MAICGYDTRMGTGLREFGNGLIAAIQTKASSHNRTESSQLQIEADQITVLVDFLRQVRRTIPLHSPRETSVTAFYGLVLLSQGLLGTHAGPRRAAEPLATVVSRNTETLISLLIEFERLYDSMPEDDSALRHTAITWQGIVERLGSAEPFIE